MRKIFVGFPLRVTLLLLMTFVIVTNPVCQAGLSRDQDKTRIAVVEFESRGGLSSDTGKIIADWLLTSLSQESSFEVVAREVLLRKVLNEQALGASGMIDSGSAARIGNIYGASGIITGSVTKLGETYTVEARLLNAQDGSVIRAESIETANIDSLRRLMSVLSSKLAGKKGYVLESIRFFDGRSGGSDEKKLYVPRINNNAAHYAGVEVAINNPYYGIRDSECEVQIEYFGVDGRLLGKSAKYVRMDRTWPSGVLTDTALSQDMIKVPGPYTVKVYFEKNFAFQTRLEVYAGSGARHVKPVEARKTMAVLAAFDGKGMQERMAPTKDFLRMVEDITKVRRDRDKNLLIESVAKSNLLAKQSVPSFSNQADLSDLPTSAWITIGREQGYDLILILNFSIISFKEYANLHTDLNAKVAVSGKLFDVRTGKYIYEGTAKGEGGGMRVYGIGFATAQSSIMEAAKGSLDKYFEEAAETEALLIH